MLPKAKRLTRSDFSGMGERTVIRGAYFDAAISPRESSRFAVVVAKKRFKRAVERNKVRRKIYAAIGNTEPKLPHTIIFYPKTLAALAPRQTLEEEIKSLFATL